MARYFSNFTGLKWLFHKLPKKMGPVRKNFLLLLMRMKIDLAEKDLTDTFKLLLILTCNIIRSFLRGTADTLRKFVFVPDQGVSNKTKPAHSQPEHSQPTNEMYTLALMLQIFLLRHQTVTKINI